MMSTASARPRLPLAVVLGLLSLLAVTVPVSLTATAAGAAGGDPNYQLPVVGQCLDYSYKTYLKPADGSAAVDCAGPHTAVTIAVKKLPKRVHLSSTKISLAAFNALGHSCYNAADRALGGGASKRAQTAYSISYYVPTRAQQAQGAHWIRCDLVLPTTRKLTPLPTPLLGSLSDSVRRCLSVSRKAVLTTVCDGRHNYRSTKVFTLRSKRFPGVKALQHQALAHCQLGKGVGFFASWPAEFEWNHSSHRQLVCYRQTSS